uniref:Integrator complex subunit 7 n=1 Tax=Syphacia muris TaxID=451379 RepID=A0A0N5AI44_9BILA
MGDTSLKQQLALQAIDKGLQTRLLHEQMATIVKLPTYFRENPFPLFINTVLIRMSEAFRDGSNDLRLCLVRVMGECTEELKLVFSNEEIARRILKVSHATDSVARSLTLQMLAKLAPIVAENKQVHHLIAISIDSSEQHERLAAIVAMKAFVAASKTFSKTIFEKLCFLLSSPSVPSARKILLCEVFASMRTDIDLTMRIFTLAEIILNSTCNQRVIFSLFTSLTTLACSSKVAAAELLTILIKRMKLSLNNPILCIVILHNIKRLSSAAHMLSESEIRCLFELYSLITDDRVLAAWLTVVLRFSVQGIHKINQILSEFVSRWQVLLVKKNVKCKLYALHLYVNLYSLFRSSDLCLLLFTSFTFHLRNKIATDSEKFFRIITAFVLIDACPLELVNGLVEEVISSDSNTSSFVNIIRFLIATAETYPHLYTRLAQWSAEKLSNHIDFSSITMFALLVYAPFEKLNFLPENHIDCWGSNSWIRYLVARTAMRNGHFKRVALPLLQSIQNEFKSFESALWISVLIDFCSASLESFNMDAIEHSLSSYSRAHVSLKALCSSYQSKQYFSFAQEYTECLVSLLSVFRDILLTVNTVVHLSADPLPPYIKSRVSLRFKEHHLRMIGCRDLFSNLYGSCFDADQNTLSLIDMYIVMCSILDSALLLYVQNNFSPPPEIAKVQHTSFITEHFRKTLVWTKDQIEKLADFEFDKRINRKHTTDLMKIFEHLICLPIGVPRFFFQQFKNTHVKLNVSPQSTSNDLSVNVMSSQQLPITVEGVIEGADTSSIGRVLVHATIKFQKNAHELTRTVSTTLKDEKFFQVQFLQTFLQSCTISFSVEFMDKETRRLWKTDGKADLSITVCDRR